MAIRDYLPRILGGRDELPTPEQAVVTKPPEGQQTSVSGFSYGATYGPGWAMVHPVYGSDTYEVGGRCIRGTFELYARMDNDPTLTLARERIAGLVDAGEWKVEVADGVPEGLKAAVSETLLPFRSFFLQSATLVYGFTPFEMVWGPVKNRWGEGLPSSLWLPTRAVELPRGTTSVLEDKLGNYVGLRTDVDLIGPAALTLKCDAFGPYRQYGRSWYEAAKENYVAYKRLECQLDRLGDKVSGTYVIIKYPESKIKKADGTFAEARDVALELGHAISTGGNVAIQPGQYKITPEMIMKEPRVAELLNYTGWTFDVIDAGNIAAAQEGMRNIMAHREKLLVRAMRTAERSLLEAETAGSRADSESHGDVSIGAASRFHRGLVDTINEWVVRPLLYFNLGEGHERDAELVAGSIIDTKKAAADAVYTDVMSDPTVRKALARKLNWTAWADEHGISYDGDELDLEIPDEQPVVPPAKVNGNGNGRLVSQQ